MGRKPRVDRSPEEKWQIVQEGMKSGNVSETCRRYGIAQTLSVAGRTNPSREQRQRLGGEALRQKAGPPSTPGCSGRTRWNSSCAIISSGGPISATIFGV